MDKVMKTFEDLIRRMVAPSTTLFMLIMAVHVLEAALNSNNRVNILWHHWVQELGTLANTKSGVLLGAGLLVAMVGTSYVLSMLHQLCFDRFLRGSFSPSRGTDRLSHLRIAVKKRMEEGNHAELKTVALAIDQIDDSGDHWEKLDYVLYEILGGIDTANTRGFVNDAKAFGIIAISASLALWTLVLTHPSSLSIWIIAVTGSFACMLVGRMLVKAQYRARALRLYVNFLMMPDEKITARLLDYKRENNSDGTREPASAEASATAQAPSPAPETAIPPQQIAPPNEPTQAPEASDTDGN